MRGVPLPRSLFIELEGMALFYGYISGDTQKSEERQRSLLDNCGIQEECLFRRHGAGAVALPTVLDRLQKGDTLMMESLGCLDSLVEFKALAACVREKGASVLLIQEDLEVKPSNVQLLDTLIQGVRRIAERQASRVYIHKRSGRPRTDAERLRIALKMYDTGDITVTSICHKLNISRSVLYRAILERKQNQIAQAL